MAARDTRKASAGADAHPDLEAAFTSQDGRALTVSRESLVENGDDARFRALVHDLLAFSARLEAVRASFGAHLDLTGVQYTILISVRQLQGQDGVGVKTVAEHVGLSGAFVTIETGKLIKRGLMEKRPNPEDRRRVLLQVTPEGDRQLRALAPVQRDINDAIFDGLDREDFLRLCAIAARLRADSDKALALAEYLLKRGAADAGQAAAQDAGETGA